MTLRLPHSIMRLRPFPRRGAGLRLAARRQGFSLIEVLVVVAIIAVLAAVLLPSLLKARQQTWRMMCQANLRQIMLGWRMYLDANKNRFPRYRRDPNIPTTDPEHDVGRLEHITFGGKQGAAEDYQGPRRLNRYLGIERTVHGGTAAELFRCPADRGGLIQLETLDPPSTYSSHYDYYGTSYRANRYLIGPMPPYLWIADPCYDVLSTAEEWVKTEFPPTIRDASKLIVMGDFGWEDCWHMTGKFPRVVWHADPPQRISASWHNIAFMDGHASFIEIRKGLHIRHDYTVVPFRNLESAISECQAEWPPPDVPPDGG